MSSKCTIETPPTSTHCSCFSLCPGRTGVKKVHEHDRGHTYLSRARDAHGDDDASISTPALTLTHPPTHPLLRVSCRRPANTRKLLMCGHSVCCCCCFSVLSFTTHTHTHALAGVMLYAMLAGRFPFYNTKATTPPRPHILPLGCSHAQK